MYHALPVFTPFSKKLPCCISLVEKETEFLFQTLNEAVYLTQLLGEGKKCF